MNTQEIESYIKYQTERGTPRPEIERVLKLNQVKPEDIAQVFASLGPISPAPTAPPTPAPTMPPPPPPSPAMPNPTPPMAPPPPPTPPSPMPTPPPAPPTPPPSSGGHHWLGALILVLILVLIGGGAAYAYFFKPDWWQTIFNRPPDPAIVLAQMNENLKQVKGLEYDVLITGNGQIGASDNLSAESRGTLTLNASGASDWTSTQPKSNTNLSINTSFEGQSYSLALEARSDGENLFVKFNQLPQIPFADLSFLANRWISLSYSSTSSSPLTSTIDANLELTEKIRQTTLANNPVILTWVGVEKDEASGQKQNHFRVSFDQEKARQLISALNEIIREETGTIMEAASSTLPLPIPIEAPELAEIQKALSLFRNTSADLWLDTVENLPRKIEFKADVLESPERPQDKVTISLRAVVKSYNQPVTIVAPFESTTVEELMEEMLGTFFGGPPADWPGLEMASSTASSTATTTASSTPQ